MLGFQSTTIAPHLQEKIINITNIKYNLKHKTHSPNFLLPHIAESPETVKTIIRTSDHTTSILLLLYRQIRIPHQA